MAADVTFRRIGGRIVPIRSGGSGGKQQAKRAKAYDSAPRRGDAAHKTNKMADKVDRQAADVAHANLQRSFDHFKLAQKVRLGAFLGGAASVALAGTSNKSLVKLSALTGTASLIAAVGGTALASYHAVTMGHKTAAAVNTMNKVVANERARNRAIRGGSGRKTSV